MVGAGALRAWLRAVQPALAATFIAAPGAMIRATAALACPSTLSWPMVFELMVRVVVLVTSCQPGDTTYQSGSADESTSLSSPSGAAPRCRRPPRMHLGPATPHLDFALADHVTHFTGAAVEHFSRLQSDARPAVTGWHAHSPVAAAARIAQRLGRAVLERFTVYPDRGATLGADHVAVESRSGRSGGRRCRRLVRHPPLGPGGELHLHGAGVEIHVGGLAGRRDQQLLPVDAVAQVEQLALSADAGDGVGPFQPVLLAQDVELLQLLIDVELLLDLALFLRDAGQAFGAFPAVGLGRGKPQLGAAHRLLGAPHQAGAGCDQRQRG